MSRTAEEIEKMLQPYIKDCKNTNSIFDTNKYILYKDAADLLKTLLNIKNIDHKCDHLEVKSLSSDKEQCLSCGEIINKIHFGGG